MSKKKILKAILLALSVLLTAIQSLDGKEEYETTATHSETE